MSFDKRRIRILAESERLMDQGLIPWVWAPSPESGRFDRMAVSPKIMEELGLEQGQTINLIILDAIAAMSLQILTDKLDEMRQQAEDSQLDPDFDFRSMINDNDP